MSCSTTSKNYKLLLGEHQLPQPPAIEKTNSIKPGHTIATTVDRNISQGNTFLILTQLHS
jgi:hypothetical protein